MIGVFPDDQRETMGEEGQEDPDEGSRVGGSQKVESDAHEVAVAQHAAVEELDVVL